ncbi:hypothetical protein [Cryptosporangium aurantiacum]|uniref:Resolvase, N terminal domain n=1 Tax=Cryptosporangium aurantiacum TaxID=134849 RepID=A0A1M7Q2Z9_9ACTN|nr:hypothetical protein [Cryptosporangium aurantiacum]SHN24438.1 hypothetical protein SAMN05443668_10465 [Cryptosporangium aurantiacum]
MSLPLTPVVGYVRAPTREDVQNLRADLDEYASRARLLVRDVAREAPGASAAMLPAFAGCLEMVRKEIVRGILLPTWVHLAPNGLLGMALFRAARRGGAPLYVADLTDIPRWAVEIAASAHQVQADMIATAGAPS